MLGELVVGSAPPRVIRCDADWKNAWDWGIIVLILYSAIVVPWEFAFQRTPNHLLETVDYLVDVLFLADTVMCFYTSFMDSHGVEVLELPVIRKRYLRGFFPIDLLALIPFELIVKASKANVQLNLLQLIKLPRLLRVSRLMKRLDMFTTANFLRVIKLLFGFFLFSHWIACAWFFLGRYQEEGNVWTGSVWLVDADLCQTVRSEGYLDELTGEYAFHPDNERAQPYEVDHVAHCVDRKDHPEWYISEEHLVEAQTANGDTVLIRPDASVLTQYITSLYWSLVTLTTVGYGDISPATNTERVFTVMVMLMGAIIYASIFGNVAVLIQSFDMAQARYQDRINHLKEFCALHEVSEGVQERILRYADRIYLQTHGFHMREMLADFPSTVRRDIMRDVHKTFVANLKHASPYLGENEFFMESLLLRLQPQVCLSGDYVVKKGEVGHHTYFIKFGALEVVLEDDQRGTSAALGAILLGAGEHFGEATLLRSKRRTTSVRARIYSELFYLDRDDFRALKTDYPHEVNVFVQVAVKRINAAQAALEREHEFDDATVGANGNAADPNVLDAGDADTLGWRHSDGTDSSTGGYRESFDDGRDFRRRRSVYLGGMGDGVLKTLAAGGENVLRLFADDELKAITGERVGDDDNAALGADGTEMETAGARAGVGAGTFEPETHPITIRRGAQQCERGAAVAPSASGEPSSRVSCVPHDARERDRDRAHAKGLARVEGLLRGLGTRLEALEAGLARVAVAKPAVDVASASS